MKSTELCLASPKYLHPTPRSTQRVCPPPAPKAGGHTRREVRGINILEDARHWIGLVQYNLSTQKGSLIEQRLNAVYPK
jgi:hypothetical protein